MLTKDSKALFYFFSELIEIPQRKVHVRIPVCIRKASLDIKSSFLRGLADTDFTLTIKKKEGKLYPFVQGVSKSKALIDGVCLILKEEGISFSSFLDKHYNNKRNRTYICSRVNINGVNNIHRWFDTISFSNSRHVRTWKDFLEKRASEDSNPRPTACFCLG